MNAYAGFLVSRANRYIRLDATSAKIHLSQLLHTGLPLPVSATDRGWPVGNSPNSQQEAAAATTTTVSLRRLLILPIRLHNWMDG